MYVLQVILPPTGARLMVGSDGVWDAFDKMTKVGTMSRSWTLDTCADRMVQVSGTPTLAAIAPAAPSAESCPARRPVAAPTALQWLSWPGTQCVLCCFVHMSWTASSFRHL